MEAGHFRGFAARQGAAGELAAAGDAGDDALGDRQVENAGGVVVEKEERFRAGHQQVVDAHRHEVLADVVVALVVDGEPELRAHAVGAGGQHRFAVAGRQGGERGEAAEARKLLRAPRTGNAWRDAAHEFVAGVDVHAGVAVGQAHEIRFPGRGASAPIVPERPEQAICGRNARPASRPDGAAAPDFDSATP